VHSNDTFIGGVMCTWSCQ